MDVSLTIYEIFGVKVYRDLENWKWRRSIDHTTFYWSAIVNIALSCTVFQLLLLNNTLRGTVKWVSASGWVIIINGDSGCRFWQPVQAVSQPKSSGLVLGRAVSGRLAPFYIHQMNRVNSGNGSAMMTAPWTLSSILLLLLLSWPWNLG